MNEREIASPEGAERAKRLIHLDVVRGIAILMVLGQHTPAVVRIHPILDAVSDHFHKVGNVGVDLFFVLSGFLIGGLLFGEVSRRGTISVGRFLSRRAFKIWPAYLVCLSASCLACAFVDKDLAGDPHPLRTVFGEMWPAYLHVQNYFESTSRFAHFWSLGVEEHFYLLLPGILLLLGCRGANSRSARVFQRVGWLAIVVAVVCLGLRGLARGLDPDVGHAYTHYFPTHFRIDALMSGVGLAAAVRFAPHSIAKLRGWKWLLWLIAIGVFVLPATLANGTYTFIYPFDCTVTIFGAACAVVLAYFADLPSEGGDFRKRHSLRNWLVGLLAFVGFYSYSIYLWHAYFAPPIAKRVMEAARIPIGGTGASTVTHLGVYVAVAVSLGALGYLAVEKPFLALRDRFVPRAPVRTARPQPG